jgi:hypothetical protein
MTKIVAFIFLIFFLHSCKKEEIIPTEDPTLKANWRTILGTRSIPYATPEGVILKSGDGIRFANRVTGEIEWFVQQNNGLFPSHQNSFLHNDIFFSLESGGGYFKAIDINSGTELYDISQKGFGVDNFIRLADNEKIRFCTSYLNTISVLEMDLDGNNMDSLFTKSIDGVSDVEGLDVFETETYYFILFLANTSGISNYTVNFCAINKQTLEIERHIQGLAINYDYRLNYHFLDLKDANQQTISAVIGTDLYSFDLSLPAYLGLRQYLPQTTDVAIYDGIAYSHGFSNRDVVQFSGKYADYLQIPCQWNNIYATIAVGRDFLFFPLKDATVAVYNLETKEQRIFPTDNNSSNGIHISADSIHQIMYTTSGNFFWAVPYGE